VVRLKVRPSCELLGWDSEHFGFPIARVLGSTLDDGSAVLIDEWCRARGVRCLYFLADPDHADTSRVAAAHGYRPVEIRVTLRHELEHLSKDGPAARIREAEAGDVPALRELAARSHHGSRFYRDPGFPPDRCDALYATWVENGVRDPAGWVLMPEIRGTPVGYQVMAPATKGGIAHLELLAIDEAHQGKGVGRAVLALALRRALSHGASAVETVVHERNTPSLRVHRAVGFSPARRAVVHHRWYPR
jgi:GNAT superfamily N-acetyltransferase